MLLGFFAILTFLSGTSSLLAQSEGVPWTGIDDLNRIITTSEKTGDIRENKTVGIFYFLWNSPVSNIPKAPYAEHPYDIQKILEMDPDAEKKPDSPLWGTNGIMHFWGEPLFGYYRADDPWIQRKHIQLLADAGIDFLVFDTTNRVTYLEVLLPLCDMMKTIRAEGGKTPQITFMLNTQTGATADELWENLYKTGQYDELFFHLEGKPLLIGDPNEIQNAEIKQHLTLRKAHWPFKMVNTQNAWHWEATYPQPYGWAKNETEPEQVNVSVAQNLSRYDGTVTNMNSGMARGRSFWKNETEPEIATDEGRNFAEQWTRAYELDPPYVMITGWNEWIAGRWKRGERYDFVDQYDREYSRDIEPMTGGHFDNYYMQMIDGIRKYKGTPVKPTASEPKTIQINADFSQWNLVLPELTDHLGETIPRDFKGLGGTHYTNETGRNDLELMKIARDDNNIYFYLRTKEALTTKIPEKLCLLLNTDGNLKTGWIGGDYLIGRNYTQNEVSLEKFSGKKTKDGWKWQTCGTIQWFASNNELHLAVPLDMIGFSTKTFDLNKFAFKWLDNVPEEMTLEKLYTNGDVAPESRLFFSVSTQTVSKNGNAPH